MIASPRERKTIEWDAVYDLETSDWDEFVVGAVMYKDRTIDEFWWDNEDLLVDRLLSIEGYVWAHNGGRFDSKWLGDHCRKRKLKFQMIPSGGTIIALKVGKLTVYDSYALTKLSLEALTSALGVSKEKLGLACKGIKANGTPCTEENCKGYCRIGRGMTRSERRILSHYLGFDLKSLGNALDKLIEFAEDQDIDLAPTVGSAAWRTAARWLDLPPNELGEPGRTGDWRFARAGYFGGRCYVGRRHSERGFQYDVNSMYPGALANHGLPAGRLLSPGTDWGKRARAHYLAGRPGIYSAIVKVPAMHIPPLPIRDRKGRVCYPIGTFKGTWALPELQYAETLGCKVEPDRCVVWEKEEKIFSPWAHRLFDIRIKAPGGKSGPLGTFAKFLLNSLTGKLGSRADHETIYCNIDYDPAKHGCRCDGTCRIASPFACACRGQCSRAGCSGECGALVPMDEAEDWWSKTHFRIDDCARPQHSAYLTALSRVEWHRQAIIADGGEDVIYGDTDSLKCEIERTRRIGKELSLWNPEGPYIDLHVVAPKVYRYRSVNGVKDKVEPGGWLILAKGVRPSSPDEIIPSIPTKVGKAVILKTKPLLAERGIKGLRAGIRGGKLFTKASLYRQLRYGAGDRVYQGDATRPPHISEIEVD